MIFSWQGAYSQSLVNYRVFSKMLCKPLKELPAFIFSLTACLIQSKSAINIHQLLNILL